MAFFPLEMQSSPVQGDRSFREIETEQFEADLEIEIRA